MSRALVSVVLPTWNRAHVLRVAIDSALGQVGADVEVIVVDDGSTDGTGDLLARAYGEDARVRYVHQRNAGAAAARNAGLALATGEYVAFIDSDDAWKPWHLRLQLAGLQHVPEAGLIWANLDAVDGRNRVTIPRALTRLLSAYRHFSFDDLFRTSVPLADLGADLPREAVGGRLYSGDVFSAMIMGNLLFASTAVLRRARLEAVGGFETRLVTGEDYEFFLRCCRAGPVAFSDAASIQYRYGGADRLSGPRMALPLARGYLDVLETTLARDASRITLPASLISEARGFGHRWAAVAAIRAGEHRVAWAHLRAAFAQPGHRRRLAALAALNMLPSSLVRRLLALRELVRLAS